MSGIKVVPDPSIPPGTAMLVGENGEKVFITNLETPKPVENDDYFLHLIIQLVNGARHDKQKYRDTRKEIKRLMLENKEAREFFKIAFGSIPLPKEYK